MSWTPDPSAIEELQTVYRLDPSRVGMRPSSHEIAEGLGQQPRTLESELRILVWDYHNLAEHAQWMREARRHLELWREVRRRWFDAVVAADTPFRKSGSETDIPGWAYLLGNDDLAERISIVKEHEPLTVKACLDAFARVPANRRRGESKDAQLIDDSSLERGREIIEEVYPDDYLVAGIAGWRFEASKADLKRIGFGEESVALAANCLRAAIGHAVRAGLLWRNPLCPYALPVRTPGRSAAEQHRAIGWRAATLLSEAFHEGLAACDYAINEIDRSILEQKNKVRQRSMHPDVELGLDVVWRSLPVDDRNTGGGQPSQFALNYTILRAADMMRRVGKRRFRWHHVFTWLQIAQIGFSELSYLRQNSQIDAVIRQRAERARKTLRERAAKFVTEPTVRQRVVR